MFFEGAEKKLEVYLKPEVEVDLRQLPASFWNEMVQAVNAQIISKIENENCQAFLLSESSLFVYRQTFTMITCGTTQLVKSIEKFMEKFNKDQIEALFYERKNEIFGHYQPSHFFDDVRELRKYVDGTAYRFGEESEHHIYLFSTEDNFVADADDCTLEVLMNGLRGPAKEVFMCKENLTGEEVRDRSGLASLLEGFEIDDYVFHPCGYSLNALKDSFYVTIHVTPEAVGSYTSFETNAASPELREKWIQKVIEVFKPSSFDVLLFDVQVSSSLDIQKYMLKSQYVSALDCGLKVQYFSFFEPQKEAQEAFVYRSEI